MRSALLALWIGACLSLTPGFLLALDAPPALDVKPQSRDYVPWWLARHQQKLAQAAAKPPRIVLLGDSITHNYELSSPYPAYDFQRVWRKFYEPKEALNLGFNGDTTVNALWRIEHGAIDGLKPEVLILHIGTNDTIQGQSVAQTVQGVDALIAAIQHRTPRTRILVLSILPSRVSAEKDAKDLLINTELARKYRRARGVDFVDLSPLFRNGQNLKVELFMDQRADPEAPPLHPDAHAQELMAQQVEAVIARLPAQ